MRSSPRTPQAAPQSACHLGLCSDWSPPLKPTPWARLLAGGFKAGVSGTSSSEWNWMRSAESSALRAQASVFDTNSEGKGAMASGRSNGGPQVIENQRGRIHTQNWYGPALQSVWSHPHPCWLLELLSLWKALDNFLDTSAGTAFRSGHHDQCNCETALLATQVWSMQI